jgi:hypothetical protein
MNYTRRVICSTVAAKLFGRWKICWLKEKLIPNLEPNSVLVTDNVPYHNIQKNKGPTSNQIKNWLLVRNIPFYDSAKGTAL